jgi:hypothetical protein
MGGLIDHLFESSSGQTKEYKIDICCFSDISSRILNE